ncbi:hypothetical protein CHCC20375_2467 [Bacillus licheniformis]|nr:hypothetical protein CHCC20375_2467 [Bacillus licheniformis]
MSDSFRLMKTGLTIDSGFYQFIGKIFFCIQKTHEIEFS